MLSIGILTHFAPKTLANTLSTYKKAGLFDVSDDIFVVIQMSERQDQEKKVCDMFGIRAVCLPDNGNMASGFKAIYENAKYEYVLFLENDFILQTTPAETKTFIENALHFLQHKRVDIVRGRSRKYPGEPNYAEKHTYVHPDEFVESSELSECIYWVSDPERLYPTKISRVQPLITGDTWYQSLSESCNYTNNPYVCSKTFFRKYILPYLRFGGSIEKDIAAIWQKSHHRCVFGPGLFTHNRYLDGHS